MCSLCFAQWPPLPAEHRHEQSIFARLCYAGPWRTALHRLKYDGQLSMAGPLGRELARAEVLSDARWELVVPVPLHWTRLSRRGFNQTSVMLDVAARVRRDGLRRRIDRGLLQRSRASPAQARLQAGSKGRRSNVEGAFCVPTRARRRIREARVLVVDDVTTTGATLQACRTALMASGAAEVAALALMRTPESA